MSFISNYAEFLEPALQSIEATFGNTFTWRGNSTVPCTVSHLRRGLTIVIGAKEVEIICDLIVRESNFLTIDTTLETIDSTLWTIDNDMKHPVAGMTLIFDSKTYRILEAKEDATGSHYVLALGDPNV